MFSAASAYLKRVTVITSEMILRKVISVENYWVCQAERRQKSFWMEEAALTKEENAELLFWEGQVRKNVD